MTILTSVVVPQSVETTWEILSDLEGHVAWMSDTLAIRFKNSQHRGVGTRMEVDTRVGPFRLTDHLEVTDWEEGHIIEVRHSGQVTGTGLLRLDAVAGGTRVSRVEDLWFPWYLGGPLTARVAAVVLHEIWQRDLRTFRDLVERF